MQLRQLHDEIRRARKELGMTQADLAAAAGVQRKQISILEKGGNVTLATIRKVLAQLPNIERFSLFSAEVGLDPSILTKRDWDHLTRTMVAIGDMYKRLNALMADFHAAMAAGDRETAERIFAEVKDFPPHEYRELFATELPGVSMAPELPRRRR